MAINERYQVLDCQIDRIDMDSALKRVSSDFASGAGGYVCFANVHTVVTSRKDLHLRNIINKSCMSMPDGKPLSILARLRKLPGVGRVAGPDFMMRMLDEQRHLRHYFFGSTEHTLERLQQELTTKLPGINIAGVYSPPFHELSAQEANQVIAKINQQTPDVIWVGLGAPKQEYWMAEHWQQLRPAMLLGVGAAFDFHAGVKPRAPEWMKNFGLEWLHRLGSEPGRLWRRYLSTNTRFLFYLLADTLSAKK